MNAASVGVLSRQVHQCMDKIGYSPDMVKYRRQKYRQRDELKNRQRSGVTSYKVGSKGEGFTSYNESDHDRMYIDNNLVGVTSRDDSIGTTSKNDYVFDMMSDQCHPGHYKLKLFQKGTPAVKYVEDSLVVCNGEYYMSSEIFVENLQSIPRYSGNYQGWERRQRTGPAIPAARGLYCRDDVQAIRCPSQRNLLATWAKRPREHGWPSAKLIRDVIETEAQLVPVGCKGSVSRNMEWRLCFNTGELKLTDDFNEVQYKLYILLKMINKELLIPISPDLSSYMFKNIVFWLVERNPPTIFTADRFLGLMETALQMFYDAVCLDKLDYYMIEGRNLLFGRLTYKGALKKKLKELQSDGPEVVFQCKKLRKALKTDPESLEASCVRRDELERLQLDMGIIWADVWKPDMKDWDMNARVWEMENYRQVTYRQYNIAIPEWERLVTSVSGETKLLPEIPELKQEERARLYASYRKQARELYDIVVPFWKIDRGIEVDGEFKERVIELIAALHLTIEIMLS